MCNGSFWRAADSAQEHHSMMDSRLRRLTGNLLQPNGGGSQRSGGGEPQTDGFKLGNGTNYAGRGIAPGQKRTAERVCIRSKLVLYETLVCMLYCTPRLGAKSLFGLVCEDGFQHRGKQRHHHVEHKTCGYRGNGTGLACRIRTWFRFIQPWGHGDLCKLVSTQLAGVMAHGRGKADKSGLNSVNHNPGEAQCGSSVHFCLGGQHARLQHRLSRETKPRGRINSVCVRVLSREKGIVPLGLSDRRNKPRSGKFPEKTGSNEQGQCPGMVGSNERGTMPEYRKFDTKGQALLRLSDRRNQPRSGKCPETSGSNEQGQYPGMVGSNERGTMPECRKFDENERLCWLIQAEHVPFVDISARAASESLCRTTHGKCHKQHGDRNQRNYCGTDTDTGIGYGNRGKCASSTGNRSVECTHSEWRQALKLWQDSLSLVLESRKRSRSLRRSSEWQIAQNKHNAAGSSNIR